MTEMFQEQARYAVESVRLTQRRATKENDLSAGAYPQSRPHKNTKREHQDLHSTLKFALSPDMQTSEFR